jgi:DNA-binding NarL/FixJ family response regulator
MRVLVADDQAKVRSALRLLLLERQPDVEVVGEAVDAKGLLAWANSVCPDVILLDWELPGLQTSTIIALLHRRCPAVRVIALSSRPEVRQKALNAGAHDFVSKGDPAEILLQALRSVSQREQGISSE